MILYHRMNQYQEFSLKKWKKGVLLHHCWNDRSTHRQRRYSTYDTSYERCFCHVPKNRPNAEVFTTGALQKRPRQLKRLHSKCPRGRFSPLFPSLYLLGQEFTSRPFYTYVVYAHPDTRRITEPHAKAVAGESGPFSYLTPTSGQKGHHLSFPANWLANTL